MKKLINWYRYRKAKKMLMIADAIGYADNTMSGADDLQPDTATLFRRQLEPFEETCFRWGIKYQIVEEFKDFHGEDCIQVKPL